MVCEGGWAGLTSCVRADAQMCCLLLKKSHKLADCQPICIKNMPIIYILIIKHNCSAVAVFFHLELCHTDITWLFTCVSFKKNNVWKLWYKNLILKNFLFLLHADSMEQFLAGRVTPHSFFVCCRAPPQTKVDHNIIKRLSQHHHIITDSSKACCGNRSQAPVFFCLALLTFS